MKVQKATKICRICGKEYPACQSIRRGDGIFHYREVACSPECGKEYLRRVIDDRTPPEEIVPPEPAEAVADVTQASIESDTVYNLEDSEPEDSTY